MPPASEQWEQARSTLNIPVSSRTAACMGAFLQDRQRTETLICGGPALSQALAGQVADAFSRAGHRLTLRALAGDWFASPSHLYLVYPAPMAVFETAWEHVSTLSVTPARSSFSGTLLGRLWERDRAPGRPSDLMVATSGLVWWQGNTQGAFVARQPHEAVFTIEAMDPSSRDDLLELVRSHWPALSQAGD